MSNALLLALLMCANYLVIAVNMRACAHLKYKWIVATDAAICLLNFSIIHRVAEAATWVDQLGYTIGGVSGAVAGVWLSSKWND
jgi:hypothetical protein